jgi:hypothetical protein
VLSSTTVAPLPTQYNDQLTYDPTTGNLYTVEDNSYLGVISSGGTQSSVVGTGIGASFNFEGLAADPSGNLWLATDDNGGELWSINKQTGVGTLQTRIHIPVDFQITSLAIDANDDFVVYGLSQIFNSPNYIFSVNPTNGTTAVLTLGAPNPEALLNSMAFDPQNNALYGILEDRSVDPRTYSLVQVTGIPEPGALGICCCGGALLLRRRKREVAPDGDRFAHQSPA